MLVAVQDDRHVAYYLPEYRHIKLDPIVNANVHEALPPGVKQVVIFDKYLELSGVNAEESLSIPTDHKLSYINRKPEQQSVILDWRNRIVTLVSN
ncbi:MAG: hypothetical protein ACYDGS_01420 [Thermoleophilia bacterium]